MDYSVRIQRFFPIKNTQLFEYFVHKDLLERWFNPIDMVVRFYKLDAVTGGHYHYVLLGKEGEWSCEGKFLEVETPYGIVMQDRRLLDPRSNTVTTNITTEIEFHGTGEGVRLNLVQIGFFNSEAASASKTGWEQRLSYLAGIVDMDASGKIVKADPTAYGPH